MSDSARHNGADLEAPFGVTKRFSFLIPILLLLSLQARAADVSFLPMWLRQSLKADAYSDNVETRMKAYNRTKVPDARYPYSTIGKLVIYNDDVDYACTAALVSPCHIVTARHCVESATKLGFFPHFGVSGGRGYVAPVKGKVAAKGSSFFEDWAIIELEKRAGDELGWMPLAPNLTPEVYQTLSYRMAGYALAVTEKFMTLTPELTDVELRYGLLSRTNMLWSNAQVGPGDSGGPLWSIIRGRPTITGIAHATNRFTSGASYAQTGAAANALKSLRPACEGKPSVKAFSL